ncbi:MAG: hypothetical protein A3J52_00015 [Omnitrophica bacterium RIFCSPHIGHO2_02_FULL_49_9]|nr:MAG: hypothetical protein A3J52_00015 [Omnitrophica bacterium RIFCSPHIGHO2_02_FULL_49_9]OGW89168.1 MAG: hypothetical protein A3A73_04710 [Omnitrophica bacterium RIFCSPLOWO2_01_FULL_50_24]
MGLRHELLLGLNDLREVIITKRRKTARILELRSHFRVPPGMSFPRKRESTTLDPRLKHAGMTKNVQSHFFLAK